MIGVQDGAGTGKTTALKPLREMIAATGYETIGPAPTSGAARELASSLGMEARTLQRFLARESGNAERPRAYFLDESSLASTKQVHEFLGKVRPQDRVLFVGDIRQHQSVEAGRIFEELQDAGMPTFALTQIARQKDPELLKAVESFAAGEIEHCLELLEEQGRTHEQPSQHDRYRAIAKAYAQNPQHTLVISPDNESRRTINEASRSELRASGELGSDMASVRVLRARQDLTKDDLLQPFSYEPGMSSAIRRVTRYSVWTPRITALVLERMTFRSECAWRTAENWRMSRAGPAASSSSQPSSEPLLSAIAFKLRSRGVHGRSPIGILPPSRESMNLATYASA